MPRNRDADLSVVGAGQLGDLARVLRQTGNTTLKRELTNGLRRAARPLLPVAKAAYRAELPQRGGLARAYARRPARVQVRTGNDPGVSLVFAKADRRLEETGRLVHPVFGRRPPVVQQVPRGIVNRSIEGRTDAVRDELLDTLSRVAAQISREV